MAKRCSLSLGGNAKRQRREQQPFERPNPSLPDCTSFRDHEDWGDDPDDEMLLLATQACERAEVCNMSIIAEQAFNMKPRLTNTQKTIINAPQGDPDRLRKLVDLSHNQNVVDLTFDDIDRSIKFYENNSDDSMDNKYNRSKLNENKDVAEFMLKTKTEIINRRNSKGGSFSNYCETGITNMSSSEQMRLLLENLKKLEVKNEELKRQHNNLMENCLTKDGEVSILRTQVKNMQSQLSLTKSNHIKHQEIAQIEWNEKFKESKLEVENHLSTIEFKNLEILNLKEKCKMLESSKVRFVEPQLATLDNKSKWMSFTQNMNTSIAKFTQNVVKPTSTKEQSNQTEIKSPPNRLHPLPKTSYPLWTSINKSIFQRSAAEMPLSFTSNKRLQYDKRFSYIKNKQLPLPKTGSEMKRKRKPFFQVNENVDTFYRKLNNLMNTQDDLIDSDESLENASYIILLARDLLLKSAEQLMELKKNSTFQSAREMDEKYLELSGMSFDLLTQKDPFSGESWFPKEQCIDTRRVIAILTVLCRHIKPLAPYILGHSKTFGSTYAIHELKETFQNESETLEMNEKCTFLDIISALLKYIGEIGCSMYYTGLSSSLCRLIHSCIERVNDSASSDKLYEIIREFISLRPHARVLSDIANLLGLATIHENFIKRLCHDVDTGNIIFDSNEGVSVYGENTCFLQILFNNFETWSPHFLEKDDMENVFAFADCLLRLHQNGGRMNANWAKYSSDYKCLCSIRMSRCLCSCLHKCAILYRDHVYYLDKNIHRKFNSIIRAGIIVLNFSVMNDVEFVFRLCDYESRYQIFVETCNEVKDHLQLQDVHKEALADLSESIIPITDNSDESCPETKACWDSCFEEFENENSNNIT